MPERDYPDREPRDLEDPAFDNLLPGLDLMLRDAADDAARRAPVPPYDLVRGLARSRRSARVAAAGVFGVVLCLAIGVAAVAGAGRGRDPDPRPAASAVVLDPSLRRYWTTIPIVAWTPAEGHAASDVIKTNEFLAAVPAALRGGDQDYSHIDDLRERFPDAPVGGPAVAIDQSVTRAQVERVAANLRKLDGVRDARVVEVTGLWFTVSATVTAPATGAPRAIAPTVPPDGERSPSIDLTGIPISSSASGHERDAQNRVVRWVRATYVGPAIDRAIFDLLLTRTAEALQVDVSQVVVTAESATG